MGLVIVGDFGIDEISAFTKARSEFLEVEKLHSPSLKQKSQLRWSADGDENSRFFHGMIRGRLKKNSINGLNFNGSWIKYPTAVKKEIMNFFVKQFNETEVVRPDFISSNFKTILPRQVADLERPFFEDEIKQAVWSCEGSKALGPDGITISFVKKHWESSSSLIFFRLLLLSEKLDGSRVDATRPLSLRFLRYWMHF